MQAQKYLILTALFTVALSVSMSVASGEADKTAETRGKYIVEIGGCNDCHTSGYAENGGTTPEAQWLSGDALGYRGPWGTTYPANLRAYVGEITEDEWVAKAEVLRTRPPMPWWALNAMTQDDLRAMYRYIKSLGYIKKEVPAYVPPPGIPETPYIQWPAPPPPN